MTTQAQDGPIPVILDKYIEPEDFKKLLRASVPFIDRQGWHKDAGRTIMQIDPSKIKEANEVLKKYNIHLEQKAQFSTDAKTQGKQHHDIQVFIDIPTKMALVYLDGQKHEVSFEKVDELYMVLSKYPEPIPRLVWEELATRKRLFPEMIAAIETIELAAKAGLVNKDRGRQVREYLLEMIPSLFEGERETYYNHYWFPLLLLQKLGLADRVEPNRQVFLTEKGKEAKGWVEVAAAELGSAN